MRLLVRRMMADKELSLRDLSSLLKKAKLPRLSIEYPIRGHVMKIWMASSSFEEDNLRQRIFVGNEDGQQMKRIENVMIAMPVYIVLHRNRRALDIFTEHYSWDLNHNFLARIAEALFEKQSKWKFENERSTRPENIWGKIIPKEIRVSNRGHWYGALAAQASFDLPGKMRRRSVGEILREFPTGTEVSEVEIDSSYKARGLKLYSFTLQSAFGTELFIGRSNPRDISLGEFANKLEEKTFCLFVSEVCNLLFNERKRRHLVSRRAREH